MNRNATGTQPERCLTFGHVFVRASGVSGKCDEKADVGGRIESKGANATRYLKLPVSFDGNNDFVTSKKTAWDVRNWKPGQFSESVELSFNVPAGKYQLALGIRDPWKDRPAIRFANQVPVIDGWTVLSQLKIIR